MAARRRRGRPLPVLLLLLVVGAAACSAASGKVVEFRQPGTAAASTAPTEAVAYPRVEATIRPQRPITIAFAGDVHFEGILRSRLDDPSTALEPIANELSVADLAIVNLETAIGTSGTPESKRYTFQAPPSAFAALSAAGVDVVTMANNHGVDFGPRGLSETLSAASAAAEFDPPLAVVGIGEDIDHAHAPARFTIDGTTVAVLGASAADEDPSANPTWHWAATTGRGGIATTEDPRNLTAAVEAARRDADVVVVYLHWGEQGKSCPSAAQTDLAQAMADAGADIVVGSHAHRLQGAGMLGDTYVAYGLGNFVWYVQTSEAATRTGVLTLTVQNGAVVDDSWAPARIGSSGLPEFVDGADAALLIAEFRDLRTCANLAQLGP